MNKTNFDLIVIGAGAAGIMAAIIGARLGKKVLLLEKLPQIGTKLKATGGGRCNLTNTLSNEEFMASFGRNGRFMQEALNNFGHKNLVDFFEELGVTTHAPDGFRVFPKTHNSLTIVEALINEVKRLEITLLTSQRVEKILMENNKIIGVKTTDSFFASSVIIATGGLGYPMLGAEGDGYKIAKDLGHTVTNLYPAMMPLHTKEKWINCRADTIAKAEIRVALAKYKKLKATGDLIFTNNGIRGPVVLDFAREITPLLTTFSEVPIIVNLTKGMNEDMILKYLKIEAQKNPQNRVVDLLHKLLPKSIAQEICLLSEVSPDTLWSKINGANKDLLIKNLAWTPLTVIGHDGFEKAMITRGGVNLKEINPKTMESKLIKGLYFCGEVMDIDGPCGGYNLQWSFSSGAMAGKISQIKKLENL